MLGAQRSKRVAGGAQSCRRKLLRARRRSLGKRARVVEHRAPKHHRIGGEHDSLEHHQLRVLLAQRWPKLRHKQRTANYKQRSHQDDAHARPLRVTAGNHARRILQRAAGDCDARQQRHCRPPGQQRSAEVDEHQSADRQHHVRKACVCTQLQAQPAARVRREQVVVDGVSEKHAARVAEP